MPDLFEVSSQSAWSFITDPTITLPHFQRKSTWNRSQRFGLALSVFRGFPIGTVVVKKQKLSGQPPITLLLDGRQRRETLQEMRNPENLWAWAIKELNLKSADRGDPNAVIEAFERYVDQFFYGQELTGSLAGEHRSDQSIEVETETDEPLDDGGSSEAPPDESLDAEESVSIDDSAVASSVADPEYGGLDDLLRLVLLVGTVTARGRKSGMREPFDFSKHVPTLEYLATDPKTGKAFVSPTELLRWLRERRQAAADTGEGYPPSADEFLRWIQAGKQIEKPAQLASLFEANWPEIEKTLNLLETLDQRLRDTAVGYVEIREAATASDDMKIFSLINTGGTELTAVEVLCATPTWNETIESPPKEVIASAQELYLKRGVGAFDGGVRKWDVAATVVDRLVVPIILGDPRRWSWDETNKAAFERKLNLGFRIMSGLYDRKLMKKDVAHLASNPSVPWGTLQTEGLLNGTSSDLLKVSFFQYLRAWGFNFYEHSSEYLAINYLLLTTLDRSRKGNPAAGSARHGQFVKNATCLFDRAVFEYITQRWRGSADSKIASNLAELMVAPSLLTPVSQAEWKNLIGEVLDEGTINGRDYTLKVDPRITLLLLYMNAIRQEKPDPVEPFQIDHIIPRFLYEQNDDAVLGANENHITNLAPINNTLNNQKRERRLDEITDPWRRGEISRLIGISADRFPEFGAVAKSPDLRAARGELIRRVFLEKRPKLLDDPIHFDFKTS
jgi:hypothetical protein